jgi:hypothetical protein
VFGARIAQSATSCRIRFRAEVSIFSLSIATRVAVVSLSSGVKQSGLEVNDLPQSSAEVKNTWSYAATSPYIIMTLWLITHREKFMFASIFSFPFLPFLIAHIFRAVPTVLHTYFVGLSSQSLFEDQLSCLHCLHACTQLAVGMQHTRLGLFSPSV